MGKLDFRARGLGMAALVAAAAMLPILALAAGTGGEQQLQRLVEAEHTAVLSKDAARIVGSCRDLVSFALADLAEMRVGAADKSEAIKLYKSSLATKPSGTAELSLAAVLIASGQVSAGRELAGEVLVAEPANARAAALSRGEGAAVGPAVPIVGAEASLALEGKLRRDLSIAYGDWGTAVIREQQDYAGALLLFEAAAHWDPTAPGTMRNVGLAAFRLGKYEDSEAAFRAVLEAQPADGEARMLLGLSLFSLKQFAEAAATFSPAAESVMGDSRAAYAWAFSLAHTGQPQQANHIIDQLVERPLPPEELALACQVYEQTENYEHAISCLEKVSAASPSMMKVHYGIGVSLIHLSRPAEAVAELQKELVLEPGDPDVRYYYAYALLATSQKLEAQAVLASLVEERPGYGQAQYELGKLLAEQGKWVEAISHLQAAAVSEPRDYDIHYQLQNAYRKNGQNEEAARELALYKSIKAGAR